MSVVAHAGHWIVNVLYAALLVAVIAMLTWDRLRRRREGDEPSEPSHGDGLTDTTERRT
jgi:hypothetical protein